MSSISKFCINCASYSARNGACGAAGAVRHVNPVNGKTLYESAEAMRANQNMCGDDAVWFSENTVITPWWKKSW